MRLPHTHAEARLALPLGERDHLKPHPRSRLRREARSVEQAHFVRQTDGERLPSAGSHDAVGGRAQMDAQQLRALHQAATRVRHAAHAR